MLHYIHHEETDLKEHVNINLISLLPNQYQNKRKGVSTNRYIDKDTVEINKSMKTRSAL